MKFEKEIEIYVSIWFRLCRSRCLCSPVDTNMTSIASTLFGWYRVNLIILLVFLLFLWTNLFAFHILFALFKMDWFFQTLFWEWIRKRKKISPTVEKFVAIFQMQTWRLIRIERRNYGNGSNTVFKKSHTTIPSSTVFTDTAPIHINVSRSPDQVLYRKCFQASAKH